MQLAAPISIPKRVDPETVEWAVTLEDPTTWTKPWTFMVPMTSKPEVVMGGLQATSEIWVYPYECHEGNYGLKGILAGARADEAKMAETK